MNAISMVSTAAVAGQAAISAGTGAGTNAQAGAAGTGTSFAALFVGLITGQALPAKAQGESLVQWLTGGLNLQAETAEVGTEEPVSWEAVLSQLSALFASLPAEMKAQLAAQPEVKEWMAMANSELTMAGETVMTLIAPTQTSTEEAGQEVSETLDRLLAALKANPEAPYLPVAAEQARHVFAKALGALATMETAGANVTSALMQSMTAAQNNETTPSLSKKAADLAVLLKQTNGTVVENTSAPKPEVQVHQVRLSHLTAMEAKTSMFRFVTLDGTGTAAALETSGNLTGSGTQTTSDSTLLSGLEAMKAGATETTTKTENAVPQRVPLSNAAEQLNAWMLKHASGGGNFKTETIIRLMPEHLGQIEVKLSMQNGQLAATITTESAMAKEVLESNLSMLRSSLQGQGVTVERLVVSHQQTNGFQSGLFQEDRGRQPSGRESENGGARTRQEDDEDWADVLAGNSELEAALETYGSGSSFRAEA